MPGLAGRAVLAKPSASVDWNTYVASLSPYAWWKLDDNDNPPENNTIDDASGNARTGTFNGDSTLPDRRTTALISGSQFAVTTGNGGNLRGTHQAGMCNSSSWTMGCWIKGTATGAGTFVRRQSAYEGLAVFLNYASGNGSGRMSLYYDTGGGDANSLGVTGTGWNDGNAHLIFFEYDNSADRLAIWLGGTKIGDRARAGTKPTLTSNTYEYAFISGSALANIQIDEYLFFNRVLTSGEHAALAAYT